MSTRQIDNLLDLPTGDYFVYTKSISLPMLGDREMLFLVRKSKGTARAVACALKGEQDWQLAGDVFTAFSLEGCFNPDQVLGTAYLSKQIRCPHCGSKEVIRNGTVGGRQRWLCRDCNKTTGKPLASP